MRSGIMFSQGEIVFVPFPFTNLKLSKKRPVLILSRTDYNRRSPDFICCGITSNVKNVKNSILINQEDVIQGFLPKPSRIKYSTVFTLEKSIVIRSFGKLKEDVMKRVKEEFYKVF